MVSVSLSRSALLDILNRDYESKLRKESEISPMKIYWDEVDLDPKWGKWIDFCRRTNFELNCSSFPACFTYNQLERASNDECPNTDNNGSFSLFFYRATGHPEKSINASVPSDSTVSTPWPSPYTTLDSDENDSATEHQQTFDNWCFD